MRCGTPRGIITHWFRSETHRDMATWARALVQGSHNAINYQREFSFRCFYQVNIIIYGINMNETNKFIAFNLFLSISVSLCEMLILC